MPTLIKAPDPYGYITEITANDDELDSVITLVAASLLSSKAKEL